MALDIVDIMLIFWTLVASGTYVLGNAYENYLNQQKLLKKKNNHLKGPEEQRNNQYQANSDSSNIRQSKGYNDYQSSHPTKTTTTNEFYHQQQRSNNYADNNQSYQPSNLTKDSAYGSGASGGSDLKSSYHGSGTITYRRAQEPDSSIPTATGFNIDCVEWINKILYLFYSSDENSKYIQIISESLCRSLNEKLSNLQSSQQIASLISNNNNNNFDANPISGQNKNLSNFKLAFRDVVREASSKPELTNVRTETESNRSVSTICKIYNRRLVLDLTVTIVHQNRQQLTSGTASNIINETSRASLYDGYDPLYHGQAYQDHQGQQRQHAEQQESILYELYLENLEGKLKSVSILQDKLMIVQFMERPDTKITLKPKYDSYQTMKQQATLNEDAIINLVMQTFTQVVVDLYFGDDPDFPRFAMSAQKSAHSGNSTLRSGQLMQQTSIDTSVQQPTRKQIKQDFFSVLTNKHNKQHLAEQKEKKIFIKVNKAININYNNNVYCLIEVDEPSQRFHTAIKQGSEPVWDEHFIFNLNDKSNEMLFELWDGVPALKKKDHDRKRDKFLGMAIVSMDELQKNPVQKQLLELQSRPMESDNIAGQLYVEFLFMEHSSSASRQVAAQYQKGDVVSIDRKVTPSGYVITTTTITKPNAAVGDDKQQQTSRQQLSPSDLEGASSRAPSSLSTTPSDMEMANHYLDDQSSDLEINVPINTTTRRSRPTQRSNSILRAIKKRFSFSKTRSKSVEQRFAADSRQGPHTGTSSASVSRASSINSHTDRARSVPAFARDQQHNLPSIVINPGRGSSLDDATSDYTYTHPSSQLIIENDSDGVLRHYLIPPNLANKKSKWGKKGTKIHLYNEHQFIATHLSSPTSCHLCGRVFSRRPGKQGYVCRNCQVISHKQCHVKIDHQCPFATRNTMILEYMPTSRDSSSKSRKNNKTNISANSERKESLTPDSRQTSRRESRDF